jgi:eukaryotic-like serine/threonine-protein kinase
MSLETHSFEFDGFLLNGKEKVLLRDGKPLQITPKAFQLLQILVENHGHLVERNELLNKVWADSFVEEGNLTFTIQLLRKVLGDDKRNPRFIETVPKRGYRFVAKVKEVFRQPDTQDKIETDNSQKQVIVTKSWTNRQRLFVAAVAVFLLTAAISIGSWYFRSKDLANNAPILSTPFDLEKLSTTGKVLRAVVSPDGKNLLYVNGAFTEKQSVWLRQLASGNNTEIIPPSDHTYYGLEVSPDSNFLYFNRSSKTNPQQDIYRVPISGGIPQKILENTEGWMSLSPDSQQISFVRCLRREEENCTLLIADAASGKNEKRLVSRPRPFRIGDNQFSPNGKTIAFAVGQSQNGANEFGLLEVSLENGAERELTKEKFFNIKGLAWLPENSGLLITASRIPTKQFRIWEVSTATGSVQPLTKDAENYAELSLDKAATTLVSTQTMQNYQLSVLNRENLSNPRILADGSRVTFSPDGKIFFASLMSGNDEIWSINSDGSNQRQLTNDPADDSAPIFSGNSKTIFFASNRTGNAQTWRMDADGSNQIQITDKEPGTPLFVSPDGEWLYYHRSLKKTLWKIPTKGGQEQLVLNRFAHHFAFSPDGGKVAFLEDRDGDKFIEIVSSVDGQTVKSLKITDYKPVINEINWMPDGQEIAYVAAGDKQNFVLHRQSIDGGASEKIADLGNEQINSFAISPDGKNFAVVKGGWRHDAVLLKGLR